MRKPISATGDLFGASYTCVIWNVKILPVIPGVYDDLFSFAYQLQDGIKVKGKKEMRVKSISTGIDDLVYGELVLYSRDRHLDVFNLKEKEVEHASIGEGLYLDPKVARFFFVPSKHRLCIEIDTGINLENTKKYLQGIFCKYLEFRGISEDHTSVLELEKSPSAVGDILAYGDIWKVETRLSFTNDDFTKDYAQLIDSSGKQAGASSFSISASSETSVPLHLKGTLFEGAIELAQSNGVTEFYRGTKRRSSKKYSTKDSPRVEQFNESPEELPFAVRKFVIDMLKDKNDRDKNEPPGDDGSLPSTEGNKI